MDSGVDMGALADEPASLLCIQTDGPSFVKVLLRIVHAVAGLLGGKRGHILTAVTFNRSRGITAGRRVTTTDRIIC